MANPSPNPALENLTPFTSEYQPKNKRGKGVSATVNRLLDQAVRDPKILANIDKKYPDLLSDGKVTYRELIAVKMIAKSVEQVDNRTIQELFDRADGKPQASIDLSGSVGLYDATIIIGDDENQDSES